MEPDGSISFYIFFLLVLTFINAFFSMSEIAIITLNDNKVRKMAADGHPKAVVLTRLINEPSRFLATIQVGVTLSGYLASAVAANTFTLYILYALRDLPIATEVVRVVSLVLITLVLSFFTLVFGELVPKRVGMQYSEKISMWAARPLRLISMLEKPFVVMLSSTTNVVLRLVGIDPDRKPNQVTEEEIRMMIDVGNESGNIEEVDKDMINNIFEFDDRTAAEMMTHRTEVEAVELGTPLDDIVALAVGTGYSRIPVYEGDLDSIVGILYVKDLLGRVTKEPGDPFCLSDYVREPLYVLESTNCKMLLNQFKVQKIQLAVVVDEYGGTSGIVTMEDLLEAIVGNIQDEYDDEDEDITFIAENNYLVDGLAAFDDVAKFFAITVDDEDEDEFDTIGGYIVNQLGEIPGENEHPQVVVGNIRFTVAEMDERRIDKLRAEILPLPEAAAAQNEAAGKNA